MICQSCKSAFSMQRVHANPTEFIIDEGEIQACPECPEPLMALSDFLDGARSPLSPEDGDYLNLV